MNKLRTNDLEAILECAHKLYGHDDFATFPQALIEAVPAVLPGEYTGYTEVDPTNQKVPRAVIEPGGLDIPKLTKIMEPFVHQHPVIMYCQKTGDGTAHQISDFLSQEDYHRLELYQEFYRPLGVDDQLSITLPAPTGTIIGLSISRASWRFPERERQILNALRPHLLQAYRNAALKAQLMAASQAAHGALDRLPLGVIHLNAGLQATLITAPARRLLEAYYPGGGFPDEVMDYARSLAPFGAGSMGAAPMTIRRDRSYLVVQALKPDGRDQSALTLLLTDHPAAPPRPGTARAREFGLTPREAEVLDWLAEGKTNPEIAAILKISPRTVQKHLEHAFQKLSVETRSAALLRLLETRMSGI
ncbi:MAG TPA: helix-turn-helix transcriptional regulator [Tepidisphaeraceae bacterium]|jgi:DNA-binding CsgD family transcriptional regulator|nr:helix-turn-helix transcriptional regulator [Tepidisphaeraceae bacterium]